MNEVLDKYYNKNLRFCTLLVAKHRGNASKSGQLEVIRFILDKLKAGS